MNRLIIVFTLLLVAVCTGCASKPLSMAYKPEGKVIFEPPVAEAIFVVIEEDARPFKGRSRIGTGFYAWIPLVPYGHQQFALDNVKGSKPMPREVADTVVSDLRAVGIAQYVGYEDPSDPRQWSMKEPYYLHLTLNEGVWNRYLTLYGSSFAGVFLWIVGLPTSYGNVTLGFDAELKDSKGALLGSQTFKGKNGVTEWLYHPFSKAYGSEIPKAYNQISPQIRKFVTEHLPKKKS